MHVFKFAMQQLDECTQNIDARLVDLSLGCLVQWSTIGMAHGTIKLAPMACLAEHYELLVGCNVDRGIVCINVPISLSIASLRLKRIT